MRITFILPGIAKVPVGGYKIVYEYADRLAGRGQEVTVCHALKLPLYKNRKPVFLRYLKHKIFKTYIPSWFSIRNGINMTVIPEINDKCIPDGDAVIATFWPTAIQISKLHSGKGTKYHLVFEIERYRKEGAMSEKWIINTYKLPIHKITISSNTYYELQSLTRENIYFIEEGNAIDFNIFKLLKPIETRNDPIIGFLVMHPFSLKRPLEAMLALEKVFKTRSSSRAIIASSVFSYKQFRRWLQHNLHTSEDLLNKIEYYYKPNDYTLAELYNRCNIFVSSSVYEGFGLPGAESMACGCAFVSTDSGGVRDYAVHNETALLSPPGNPELLAHNIVTLIDDAEERKSIANNGYRKIQSFSWDKAVTEFERVLSHG